MTKYLLELGCEEIPARFVADFVETIKQRLYDSFKEASLLEETATAYTYATYRRLCIVIEGVKEKQDDEDLTLFGPPMKASKDESGNWLIPAQQFAKKHDVGVEDLSEGPDAKGVQKVMLKVHRNGREASALIPDCVYSVVSGVPLPIGMKWGTGEEGLFIRPIKWIMSLLGTTHLPVSIFGVDSDTATYGHRFLSQNDHDRSSGKVVTVSSVDAYLDVLESVSVMADPGKRREKIHAFLTENGQEGLVDNALLEEVVYLTESPTLLLGEFDQKYLELPEKVLVSCMKKHQKYFPVYEKDKLKNQFVLGAESVTDENKAQILKGNERVLVARLEDVAFFWEEDKKRPLSEYTADLEKVLFQKGAGSILEKVGRVESIAMKLLNGFGCNETEQADVKRTAELCKSDLVTQMVSELPTLQGEMGAYYAKESGENEAVCRGIREHYFPRSENDSASDLSSVGAVVSMSDRLDTLVVCFENGLIPSGSKDPWGLRRSVIGIVKVLIEKQLEMSFLDALEDAYAVLGKSPTNKDALLDFYTQRLKQYFTDKGVGTADTIAAVMSVHSMTPYRANRLIRALQSFKSENGEGFKCVVDTGVRVGRLLKKATEIATVNTDLFEHDSEHEAYDALKTTTTTIEDLSTFSKTLEHYFDDVMVMSDDMSLQKNRLSFLSEANKRYLSFADMEQFQV